MRSLSDYSLSELKLIYQILHQKLPEEAGLMDSDLLSELQRFLQQQATDDGVDVSLHSDWANWLAQQ